MAHFWRTLSAIARLKRVFRESLRQARAKIRNGEHGAHLDTVLVFSLSSPEGGEGWGEEVNGFPGSKPLPMNRVVGQASSLSSGVAGVRDELDRRDACPTTPAAPGFRVSRRELGVGRNLTPALSPLGRGEGVENSVKMHPSSGERPKTFVPDQARRSGSFALRDFPLLSLWIVV